MIQSQTMKMEHANTVAFLKSNQYSIDTDLGDYVALTIQDMDDIINWFNKHINGGTPFQGKGYIFIKASQATGLSPIYIFAHACLESGYGNSALAMDKHNYFGIGAWDIDPYNLANTMGNYMEEGIVNGAKWIKTHYYAQGCTTLRQMKAHGYATDPDWEHKIVSIANRAINQLKWEDEQYYA